MSARTQKERQDRILHPRLSWVIETALDYLDHPSVLVDVETKYPSLLHEIARAKVFKEYKTCEPWVDLSADGDFSQMTRNEHPHASAVLAMEVLERAFDPAAAVTRFVSYLEEGGLLYLTSSSGSGFDVQLLKELSNNVLPPARLNLLSVEGMTHLLQSHGFEILEFSTPGQLDLEFVLQALKNNPSITLPPVIADILLKRDAGIQDAFQEFLQRARLSSHLRIVARKTGKPR